MFLKEINRKLTKSRDQLLAQHSNKQVVSTSSTIIVASPSNPCATTNIVGSEKILNDVVNSQRVKNGKEGLGFVAKSKKKKKNNKKFTSPSQNIIFLKEGEVIKEKETNTIVGGETSRGSATHNDFAGKYNPSYVLMKSRDGHVYAIYVGTSYGDDYHWTIWVPKTLVANKRDRKSVV